MNRQFLGGLMITLMLGRESVRADSVDLQSAAMERQRSQVQAAMTVSIQRQIESVRRQRTKAVAEEAYFVMPVLLERFAPQPECDSLSPMKVQELAGRAAIQNQISPDLVMAVIHQESAYSPCAVSSKGAVGLMQLMPATATELGVTDAFDPEQNIAAGSRLLKKLLDRYRGDLNRALGAYNAGPAHVDAYGGIPPFPETENYVDSITRALEASRRAH